MLDIFILFDQHFEPILSTVLAHLEAAINVLSSLAQTVERARARVVWVWCSSPLVSPTFEPIRRRLWEREPLAEYK